MLNKLPKIKENDKKRRGRGSSSGKGNNSGRGGNRHQKAKENIPLHFEGGQAKITKKYPLLRGKGKNKSKRGETVSISLTLLNIFSNGETIDKTALVKKGIFKKSQKNLRAKVLATGKLERKLIVKLPVSGGAKKKIEQAGGKVE